MSDNTQVQKKKSKKQIKIPSKKTLNLLVKEKTLASPTRLIPILFIIIAGSYLFSKYAVVDRLDKLSRAESELSDMKNQLDMITSAYADYDEVQDQYSRYSYENFDKTIPDRLDVLDMLERRLFPICSIQSLTINGRDLNMVITDIDLETLTYINGALLIEEPLIESITIGSYTDNSDRQESGQATVTATINMTLADASSTYTPGQLEFDPDKIIADAQQSEADSENGGAAAENNSDSALDADSNAAENAAETSVTQAPEPALETTSANTDTPDAGVNSNGGAE